MSKATRESWDRAMRKFRRLNRHFYYTDFNDLPEKYQRVVLGYVQRINQSRRKSIRELRKQKG